MQFNLSVFTGNKFYLFNYVTKSLGRFVDFNRVIIPRNVELVILVIVPRSVVGSLNNDR